MKMAIIKGAKFDEGEKVLCYHRQKLYPAKCTQVEGYRFLLTNVSFIFEFFIVVLIINK